MIGTIDIILSQNVSTNINNIDPSTLYNHFNKCIYISIETFILAISLYSDIKKIVNILFYYISYI